MCRGLDRQEGRNERTAPTREGIVPCRSASHAGHGRVWGFCGERGQKFGSCWVDQPSQEVVPFLSIRIHTGGARSEKYVRLERIQHALGYVM